MDHLLDGFQEGGQLDSNGQFTVAVDRARQLVATYQLAERGLYVLKIVQALIRNGCRTVEIKLGPTRIEVRGETPDVCTPTPAQLAEALVGFVPRTKEDALQDLCLGLLSALDKSANWAQWSVVSQGVSTTAHIDRDGSVHYRQLPRNDRYLRFRAGLRHLLSQAEKQAVQARCRHAPVPISLNGSLLNRPLRFDRIHLVERHLVDPCVGPEGVTSYRSGVGNTPLNLLVDSLGPVYDQVFLLQVTPVKGRATREPYPGVGVRVPGRRAGERVIKHAPVCHSILAFSEELSGPAHVQFVKAGVSLNPLSADLGFPGLKILTGASGLKVDLSQFQVVENSALESRLEFYRPIARDMLRGLKTNLDRLGFTPPAPRGTPLHRDTSSLKGLALLGLGGAGGFLTGGFPGLLIAAGGAGALLMARNKRSEGVFREQIRARLVESGPEDSAWEPVCETDPG